MPEVIPQPSINCTDQAVLDQLSDWLTRSALPWPGQVDLNVSVVSTLPEFTETRDSFTQSGMTVWSGPPEGSVRIRWESHPAMAVVAAESASITLWLTPEAAANLEQGERGFLLVALLFALRRLGWFHIHSAALNDPSGRGWLFVGTSHSGESTTSALLARHGWSVCTDDIGFLTISNGPSSIIGYRDTIDLRAGGKSLLDASGGVEYSRRAKSGYMPEDLGGQWVQSVTPSRIVFPRIAESTTVSPLGIRDCFNRLIVSSPWILAEPIQGQAYLDALSRLATQASSYSATFGPDLIANPDLLQELIP